MKRLTSIIAVALLAFASAALMPRLAQAVVNANLVYTVTPATTSIAGTTPGTVAPDINAAHVKICQLVIYQAGTTAQNVTIYKNCTSTSAATLALTIPVIGTAGTYYPISNTMFGNFGDYIDLPYFTVRTSSTSHDVSVFVVYKSTY